MDSDSVCFLSFVGLCPFGFAFLVATISSKVIYSQHLTCKFTTESRMECIGSSTLNLD